MKHISELTRLETRRWVRNISNDPATGLKRKVEVVNLSFGSKGVQLDCEVFYLDTDGNKLEGKRFAPYIVPIKAGTGMDHKDSPVINPATGQKLTPDAEGWYDHPSPVFRYDAIMSLCGQTGIVDQYVYSFIDAADLNHEYDV